MFKSLEFLENGGGEFDKKKMFFRGIMDTQNASYHWRHGFLAGLRRPQTVKLKLFFSKYILF